jgi:hypothetical protein
VALAAAGSAFAGTVVVPGTADPFLAGAPTGASVKFDTGDVDTVTGQSPVGVAVTAGEKISISNVTGLVGNCACGSVGPTGGSLTSSDPFNATGFTELVSGFTNLPINSLVGVFYGSNPSDPGIDQVFEVGNGGVFTAPTGASAFYLATVDAYQWNNNTGAFTASLAAVPEPATWAMMLLGVVAVGAGMRYSRPARAVKVAA